VPQAQWLVLALKVALISGFLSLAGWVGLYSFLADWWTNPIGRTLVAKTTLIALLFIPTTLSLFWNLNRLDSYIAGWIDVGLIGLVSPVMLWRSIVWWRLHRAGELPRNGSAGNPGGDADGP
jgi:hypothetical protein